MRPGTGLRALAARSLAVVAAVGVVACGALPPAPDSTAATTGSVPTPPGQVPAVTVAPEPSSSPAPTRPAWLGTVELELRPDGFGYAAKTPVELRERALPPRPHLPDPPTDDFTAIISAVPDDVIARSTYRDDCPVPRRDLRYITLTFWGFDDRPHTGELIVNESVADDIVTVFGKLYEARYPIEEMRVYSRQDREAPRTGDLNVTSAYACRPVVTTTGVWSQHAYGLAIDVNPFQNPYLKDDLVVPELSKSYLNRDWRRPGMIYKGDVVYKAFRDIGWGWGGEWTYPLDYTHFSANGK